MKVQMTLLSDTIFGSGCSIPGGEDIALLCDRQGFPYYKGGTFKGIFREELERYLSWTGTEPAAAQQTLDRLMGYSGDDSAAPGKLTFSDFVLPQAVKQRMLEETGSSGSLITEALTNVRTFTAIEETGIVQKGSLRMARCVNRGLTFVAEIGCMKEDEALVTEVLSLIKWVGSMRNRGFGQVSVKVSGGDRS